MKLTEIPPSEVLRNMATVVLGELNTTRGQKTITLDRAHLIIMVGSLRDTADRVDALEQSDRALDAMAHELKITKADVARLSEQVIAERHARQMAETGNLREIGEDDENVIDLTEHFRRERGRS